MEAFLGVVVLLGALVLVFKFGSREDLGTPPRRARPITPVQKASRARTAPSAHFDEKSSKHLDHKKVVTGAAWVTDGDTVRIKKTQIRLYGIDAPELNHPYGQTAKWALHRLCKGHTIRAEITEVDRYGRTVARCYLSDGRDLSAEMVKLGLAIDWPKFSGGKYQQLETPDARKKLFLADARQKGRMHVWEKFEARQAKQ